MTRTKAAIEPLQFGEALVSDHLSGGGTPGIDHRALSLLFTGFEVRASKNCGRVQSRTVTVAVPLVGDFRGERLLADIRGQGNVSHAGRGRWAISTVTHRKVRSCFRKRNDSVLLSWEQSLGDSRMLLVSITVSAMLDAHDDAAEVLAAVDSIDFVML